MEASILRSTKKSLGLESDYTPFDQDIITHINAAFSILNQIGVGPVNGYMIEGQTNLWAEFLTDTNVQNMSRMYVYLKVRILFDPPSTGYLVESMQKQIDEALWRLNSFVDFQPVIEAIV